MSDRASGPPPAAKRAATEFIRLMIDEMTGGKVGGKPAERISTISKPALFVRTWVARTEQLDIRPEVGTMLERREGMAVGCCVRIETPTEFILTVIGEVHPKIVILREFYRRER